MAGTETAVAPLSPNIDRVTRYAPAELASREPELALLTDAWD